jgi:hypothetical protein
MVKYLHAFFMWNILCAFLDILKKRLLLFIKGFKLFLIAIGNFFLLYLNIVYLDRGFS